jgi:O-antigen ligase
MVSGLLGAAIPLILSLYWIAFWLAPESLGAPLRISVAGCSVLLGSFWYRAELSHAEVLLFRVLTVAAVVWLIPTLLANDPAHALLGWIKLVILFTVCCFTTRGLRHPPTAHVFGLALLAGGMILGAFILFTYVRYLGFSVPTYKVAREFKGIAQLGGVPLNSIAFAAVFSYVMGLCLVRANGLLLVVGVPLLLISSLFTGSRAPLVILAASVFVLLCMKGVRSQSVKVRLTSAFLALAAVAAGIVILSMVSDQALNRATEGRSHLWPVAIEKFLERPLYGFGYESWREDLVSRLPGEADLTFDLAKNLGGGYHNEYVSVLAEEGLMGALAVGLIVWLLLRSSWLLTFRKWATVPSQAWILFAAIFLLLRANFEVPGLFGYAQDPVDYLAYIFLAIVMSRFSIEEDYARLLTRTDSWSAS